ncbi:MAG: gliding motility-associated C-terminal domain-containing protein [Bacteroidota bacterium]
MKNTVTQSLSKLIIKRIVIVLTTLLSVIPFTGYATHIVGGELNYKCLGNNQYEIRLRVYRDCFTGVPDFDKPAYVGVFGSNNALLQKITMTYRGKITLPPTLAQQNPCIKTPTNICVEVTEYIETVTLPPRAGGYQLAYQRCCRNPTIDNLTNPGNQGATYYAVIPDQAVSCNSNPLFKNWPPIFLCANQPVVFDHSATDNEGDVIVYSLCSPFHGGTTGNPQPNPPNNPPYTFVNFKAPYTATDPLGGIPLSINSSTGLLTGIPTTIGQFVVGVCADEYRNGVLISTTKRDFQFNVVACQPDVSAAAASYVSDCTNHTVTFTNNSIGSTTFSWNFGDPTTTADVSTVAAPTYTYPYVGTFTVTLIAFNNSNPACNDTLLLPVTVDTCKPCGMTLAVSKVDGTCGAACTPAAPPVFVNETKGEIPNNGTAITFNHTTSGVDRLLLVEVVTYEGSSSGATYATQNLTLIDRQSTIAGSKTMWVEMYYLVNPPTGANQVIVTFPTPSPGIADDRHARAITITGVNQSSPFNGGATKASGTSCPALLSVPSGTNELIVNLIARDRNINDLILESGQTSLYPLDDLGTLEVDYWSSREPGAAGNVSTGYNWSGCGPLGWAMMAVSIKPVCSSAPVCTRIVYPVTCTGNFQMNSYGNGGGVSSGCSGSGSGNVGSPSGFTPTSINLVVNSVTLPSANPPVPPATITYLANPHSTCPKTAGYSLSGGVITFTYHLWIPGPGGSGTSGSATVVPSGGTPTYQYSWVPGGQTGATANNLTAGTYTVTVVDVNNCIQTATVRVDANSTITLAQAKTDPTSCTATDGTATVTATGGTGTLTYLWSNGQTTSSATALSAGVYTVNVTDANGCSKSQSFTLTSPSNIVVTASKTDVLCKGASNGTATADPPTGGSGTYTYVWSTSPAQSVQTAVGLSAGYYVVTVTDAVSGCRGTTAVTVGNTLLSVASSQTNIKCNGDSTGTATVIPTNGVPTLLYSWNTTPVQTIPTATGLPAGTFVGKVTDANGCMDSVTVTIAEPDKLVPEPANNSSINCAGVQTGSAYILVSGGIDPYTYSWSCNVSTDSSATGLPQGICYITVTDSNACVAMDSINIIYPSPLTLSHLYSDLICNNDNSGSATVFATGGNPGYTYSWSTAPVQTTQTALGLSAGTYTVVVTDDTGCTTSLNNVVISQPAPVTFTTASTPAGCNLSNGTATVTASGGTPGTTGTGYTYLWTPTSQTNPTATNLSAGTYTLVATDSMGCLGDTTVIVVNSGTPTAVASSVDVSCNGGNNGSATVTASGGTGTYTYSWNNGVTSTTFTATGLTAGTYIVTITAGGCSINTPVTVNQPVVISLPAPSKTDITCNGLSNGTASATATGGNSGFTYTWLPGNINSQTITTLSAGTYTVIATDSKNCSQSQTVTITQPAVISVAKDSTASGCSGPGTGSATVTASGGTPGFTYSWNTSPVQNDSAAAGLSGGTYIVTVMDKNNCTVTRSVQVLSQGSGTATADFDMSFQPTCRDGVFASFVNTSSNATSYLWIFGDGTTSTEVHPEHGYSYGTSYVVTLIAYNGSCPDTISFPITINAFNNYINPLVPNVFTPNGDGMNDCFEIKLGNGLENCVELTVFDRWGLKMYDNQNGVCWDGRTTSGNIVPDGTYFYLVKIGESEMHGAVSVLRN